MIIVFELINNHFIGEMAAVPVDKLSKTEHDELCVSYAALMLHDDGLEINVSVAPIINAFATIDPS